MRKPTESLACPAAAMPTRRHPVWVFLILTTALTALAVLFVGDSAPPAQAQQTTSDTSDTSDTSGTTGDTSDTSGTTSVYFPTSTRLANEIDKHGLRYTRRYTVAIDQPLESDSTVHMRIMPDSTATQGEDYTMALPNAPGTTTTKVLRLPAGASHASFSMWFKPDMVSEGLETVRFELVAIENAPYRVVDDYRSSKFMDREISILDNSRPIPSDADPDRGIDIAPESVTVTPKSPASYTVVLTSRPDSDVTVKAYLDEAEGPINIGLTPRVLSVSPASLTFDSSNWSTPQTFTVSSPIEVPSNGFVWDNDLFVWELDELISHSVESDDLDYDTNYWFQGGAIDDDRHLMVKVRVGGL